MPRLQPCNIALPFTTNCTYINSVELACVTGPLWPSPHGLYMVSTCPHAVSLYFYNQGPVQEQKKHKTTVYVSLLYKPLNYCQFSSKLCSLLPPANEVWGKVMSLHLSVSHSDHRGRGWCGEWEVGEVKGGCLCV